MNTLPNLINRFQQAPLILRLFIGFTLTAAALSFSVFYSRPLNAAIVPYVGWGGLTLYLFGLFPAFAAIYTPQRKQIYSIAALLALSVLFGFADTFWHSWGSAAGKNNFGNPYLTYHPMRPFFTIALPALWLSLILSPYMRKWIKES
jgi:hypothetical protein